MKRGRATDMGWKIEGGGGGRYGGWIVYVGRRWLEACRDEMRKQDLYVGPVPTVYEKIFLGLTLQTLSSEERLRRAPFCQLLGGRYLVAPRLCTILVSSNTYGCLYAVYACNAYHTIYTSPPSACRPRRGCRPKIHKPTSRCRGRSLGSHPGASSLPHPRTCRRGS